MGTHRAHIRALRSALAAGVALLLLVGASPAADDPGPNPTEAGTEGSDDLDALRREVRELRELVLLLKRQVEVLQASGGGAQAQAPPAGPAPVAQRQPTPLPPSQGPVPTRRSLMNPAISAVFLGIGRTSLHGRSDENGFDLSEAEIAFESVVDPYARVDLYLAFPDAESPEVEEGAVTTLALPASLQLKGGRFKSAFGKWNRLHSHAFPTVDQPEVLERFFGDESFTSDGLSLSVLVPNPWDLYIESSTEVGTAREGVSFNSAGRALTYLQRLTFFFTPGTSNTIETGASAAWGFSGPTDALLEALSDPAVPASVSPDERLPSTVQGLDLTWKWRPPSRNTYHSFLWQTELVRSRREVEELTPAFTLDTGTVTSLGGYSYLEGQFVRRWSTGLRMDLSSLPYDERAGIWSASAVVKFQPSEFQELRFQIRRSWLDARAAEILEEDREDTQILFQWIPVIGAHGAHKY